MFERTARHGVHAAVEPLVLLVGRTLEREVGRVVDPGRRGGVAHRAKDATDGSRPASAGLTVCTLRCLPRGVCAEVAIAAPGEPFAPCGGVVADGGTAYVTCLPGRVCLRGVEANYYCQPMACDPPCGPDAVCDFMARRCVDTGLLGAGSACGDYWLQCDPRRGLWCDASRRCVPLVAEGGACQGSECAAGLTCLDAVCGRAPRTVPSGGTCYQDDVCASGLCVGQRCATPGCWP